MAKTPWITIATALILSLSLTACDGGGEEAQEQNTSDEPTQQQSQDSMDEAGENTSDMADQAGQGEANTTAEEVVVDGPAAGDPESEGDTSDIDASGGNEDIGVDTTGDAATDSWDNTEEDVNRALEETERRFEEAEKELDEQFKAAEERDVTRDLEIGEPGEPDQQ